jgi:hypothetical protein
VDLFAIIRSIRRHWILTGVVLALTAAACGWLLVGMPRDYEARTSYVLVNPAPPPSDALIERDPSLATINRNNPYLRFANEGTVGQVLSARMGGGTVRSALVAQGAHPDYTIGPSPTSAQIVDITGTGTSAAEAERTLALVSDRMEAELAALQTVYGADDIALITPLPVAEPTPAGVVVSGTIRSLVGIAGAGVILLFAAISIAEGRLALRREEEQEADGRTAATSVIDPRTLPGPRPAASRPSSASSARPSGAHAAGAHGDDAGELPGREPQTAGAHAGD